METIIIEINYCILPCCPWYHSDLGAMDIIRKNEVSDFEFKDDIIYSILYFYRYSCILAAYIIHSDLLVDRLTLKMQYKSPNWLIHIIIINIILCIMKSQTRTLYLVKGHISDESFKKRNNFVCVYFILFIYAW